MKILITDIIFFIPKIRVRTVKLLLVESHIQRVSCMFYPFFSQLYRDGFQFLRIPHLFFMVIMFDELLKSDTEDT